MARQFGGVHPGSQGDKAKIVVAAGAVFVVLFSLLAYGLLSSGGGEQQPVETVVVQDQSDIKMVEVLVPVQEIDAGLALEPRMFRKESRPQIGVSNRVVKDFEEIRAHYSRSLIVPGQPLHRDYITSIRPTNVITANIPEGFRAVTIRVDDRTSVEGFVRPGARVDVVWTSSIRGKPAITTIVQNSRVLSAERQTGDEQQKGAAPPRTVTLLVTAQDAQKIQLASTTGQLSLSLRGDLDTGKAGSGTSITLDDLIGGPRGAQRPQENIEGTVTMGGEKYLLVNGKLVPAAGNR